MSVSVTLIGEGRPGAMGSTTEEGRGRSLHSVFILAQYVTSVQLLNFLGLSFLVGRMKVLLFLKGYPTLIEMLHIKVHWGKHASVVLKGRSIIMKSLLIIHYRKAF